MTENSYHSVWKSIYTCLNLTEQTSGVGGGHNLLVCTCLDFTELNMVECLGLKIDEMNKYNKKDQAKMMYWVLESKTNTK